MNGPTGSRPSLCDTHRDALASFGCETCGKRLCYDCVDEDDPRAGVTCRLCGGAARLLDDDEWRDFEPSEAMVEDAAVLYSEEARDRPIEPSTPGAGASVPVAPRRTVDVGGWTPAALFAHHVATPAATIAMVTALLFFLLDVRSVFLGGSGTLKWIGFWFVIATVLTARYGKMPGGAERQGCYTLALAAATLLVMVLSPWESAETGWQGPIFNGLIILGVWYFATRLTRALSLEGELWQRHTRRLYGLERLALERWQRRRDDRPARRRPAPEPAGERHGNPCAAVARLAAVALLIFFLGEPLLLAGPPETGERGLAAMVVFLLATGVVLGSASAVLTYRRVRQGGGTATTGAVPGRLLTSAGLMVLILSIALAVPGIEYRGTGELHPRRDVTSSTRDEGRAEDGSGEEGPTGQGPSEGRPHEGDSDGRPPDARRSADAPGDSGPRARRGTAPPAGPAGLLLQALSGLGQLLRIPLLLAAVALTLYGMWRLWPLLASLRWRQRLRDPWQRLRDGLRGLLRRRRRVARGRLPDPFRDLDALARLAPRDAVLTAYGRALEHFEQLGHPRAERQTPLELLSQVRRSFGNAAGGVARLLEELTAVYLRAAYSDEEVASADRQAAVTALAGLRQAAGS